MRKLKLFLINAAILTLTSLVIRTTGVFFSVYISNKIGALGMGLYQLIMSVYSFAITVASSGAGLASTRLVAEELAHGSHTGIKRAMRRCVCYSAFFGLLAWALLFFNAPFIGEVWLGDRRTISSLYLLSINLPFLAVASTFSGYFTAMRRISKNACAQIVEQFIRITATVCLLQLMVPSGLEYGCIAVVLGGSISEIGSFFYLLLLFLRDKRKLPNDGKSGKRLTPRLFGIALPVALSAYIRTGLSTIKHLMIPKGLQKHGGSPESVLAQYGMVSGMAMPVIMFPSAFLSAFSSLLVPEVTECNEQKRYERIDYIISLVFQINLFFSIGVCGVLMCFSNSLGDIIYHSQQVAGYIKILAPLAILIYLDNSVDSLLKGLNQQISAMRHDIFDLMVSIVLIWFLLPLYGIKGYIIVMFTSMLINISLSINSLVCVTSFRIRIFQWILKPAFGIIGAVAVVELIERFTFLGKVHTAASLTLSILLTCLIYYFFLRVTGSITSDEIKTIKKMLR